MTCETLPSPYDIPVARWTRGDGIDGYREYCKMFPKPEYAADLALAGLFSSRWRAIVAMREHVKTNAILDALFAQYDRLWRNAGGLFPEWLPAPPFSFGKPLPPPPNPDGRLRRSSRPVRRYYLADHSPPA